MSKMRRRSAYGVFGFLLLIAAWEIVGALHLTGASVPPPLEVLRVFATPWRLALLGRATAATLASALIGFATGTLLGCLSAVVAHLLGFLRSGLDQLAVVVNAVPAIALAPILIVTAGRESTPAALASIPVFFVVYVAASSGLRAAHARLGDVFSVLGAGRLARLYYLEAPSAMPALLNGMRVATSAAMIGAIVGEWFGAPSGLGIIILNTMLNFQIPLMWAAVLVTAAVSLSAYGVLGVLASLARRRFL